MPTLPLLALTCCNAFFRLSRSHTSSIHQFVIAGLSVSWAAKGDSVSSLPVPQASPAREEDKSSSRWICCRLSLLRPMSYLPLLSFGPFITVSGSAYPLTPPFGLGVPHELCRLRDLLCPLLTS